ncbi:MAG: Type secretion system pilin [Patescibacteria group bacterium]|nr:Type secretion system pilin [Patescibacteria group bacterium]
MKNKFKFYLLIVFSAFLILPLTNASYAQVEQNVEFQDLNFEESGEIQSSNSNHLLNRMENIAKKSGYSTDENTTSIPRIVGLVINALLSLTGLIFIFLTVIAGFRWMTSGGNPETVKKATGSLTSAVIGLILTLSAWTIWNFIFVNLIL